MKYKFIVKKTANTERNSLRIFEVTDIPGKILSDGLYLVSPEGLYLSYQYEKKTILIGDVIFPKERFSGDIPYFENLMDYFVNFKGTFYVLRIDDKTDTIEFASSIFGIFPIYYLESDSEILVSSDLNEIVAKTNSSLTVNKRFILELLLFYYPLFDQLIFSEIKNLPANSILKLKNGKFSELKYLNISAQFLKDPLPYKKYTSYLSDLFIDTVQHYFPDEPFYITFTGGFDGRTLVACALKAGKSFKTFSIGDHTIDDVTIPLLDAQALNIEHIPFYLDNQEYKSQFLKTGKDLLWSSGLMNNILYTHFPYVSSKLAADTNHILTGFGGSEIFRALDIRGAVTSHELVDFFEFSNTSEWKDRIMRSDKLNLLNKSAFKNELDALISDLETYQKSFDKTAGLNERIYIYLYEEVFRKVFGPTINSMFNDVTVRNPYFDYSFNSELLNYSIAGVYSQFLVKNPVKRYKGQVLYGHIINKTSHELALRKTGKGYRPIDLTNYQGLLFITLNFIKKKLKRKFKRDNLDFFSLVSGLELNLDELLLITNDSGFLNPIEIKHLLSKEYYNTGIKERDLILLAFSIQEYLNLYYEKDHITY